MKLKAVFFDLDGTLLDTSLDLGGALNYVLRKNNRAELPHEVIRPRVSDGAAALIKLGFGEDIFEESLTSLRQQLLDYYEANIAKLTQPFPGILELIDQFERHNLDWGIVTNKPSLYTAKLMNEMKFSKPPISIISPDQVGVSKPDPKPLLEACKQASCAPQEAIYIGDHLRDIECGKNAGMQTIAVGYGFTKSDKDHLAWNATFNVDSADQIWPILHKKMQ